MKNRTLRPPAKLRFVTSDELRCIHELLTEDMANTNDAISPAGIKNETMLHSAIARQHTSLGEILKYPSIEANAATLCYGVCCNHAFHNGNKRAALVALLAHLDKNDRAFAGTVTQEELYNLMRKIADHGFAEARSGVRDQSDVEVEAIAAWLRRHTRRIDRSERLVTFRELRGILQRFGFEFENLDGNKIDVVRYVEIEERLWFTKRRHRERQRIARIPWPRDGAVVSRAVLREIREACDLTEGHGVDSKDFYASERPVDYFINHYRTVLRRLAKT